MRYAFWGILLAAAAAGVFVAGQLDFHHGDWLAYIQKDDIWVRAFPDGEPIRVSQGGDVESPSWTAFGQLTFFQGGKMVINPADEKAPSKRDDIALIQRTLGNASGDRDITAFVRSPDGKAFAAVVDINPSGRPRDRTAHLFQISATGNEFRELPTPSDNANLQLAGWTSDSRCILVWIDVDFSTSSGGGGLPLFAVPSDGGRALPLAGQVLEYSDFISTSPHQNRVLIVSGGDRESWTNKQLILSDPQTGRSTALTDRKSAVASAAWSPDGNRIAYISAPDEGANGQKNITLRRLWIMNADGSQKRQLTSDSDYRDEHPLWSHDSRYIVFTRLDAQQNASVWMIDLSTGKTTRTLNEIASSNGVGSYGHLDWSPYLAWSAQ